VKSLPPQQHLRQPRQRVLLLLPLPQLKIQSPLVMEMLQSGVAKQMLPETQFSDLAQRAVLFARFSNF
jgi:hypothetical protein